ncbi:glycosyltransferase family 1 protein [Flavobacterium sp. GSP27]|uniref:glycosyltransferase n=1 Tax=Flavobacterium sp. GSP27 TaxID=2497489 RepID=UPI000F836614|nr:glycosyltransferase [Flavobacterium sp. GSP27]RTZ09445.1 glycosyltransferase family 1 protein [Flavobacterium sp. GSP27]
MIKKSKNIIVCTPFLDNIGGTEIEAVLTAIHFYDSNQYKRVAIFSPRKSSSSFFKEIIEERNISFVHYPTFFDFKTILFLNKILKKFGLEKPILESAYWFLISLQYTSFFILTYPGCTYFFSVFQFQFQNKKYIAKITMWHFNLLSKLHQMVYNKFTNIIVFNEEQKMFWERNNFLKNTVALDIAILNETNLLSLSQRTYEQDVLVFGYLGRISREKNLEDMILLIDFLNNKNQKKCKLVIQGKGDLLYLQELELLVVKCNLFNFVTFKKEFISPLQTHTFYQYIDVFLVTSKSEGGPMTALEAAAAGCFVMGYKIGAMQDRFGQIPNMVNQNYKSLCDSALALLNLSIFDKNTILNEFRQFYILKLSNSIKACKLNLLFK